MKIWCLFSVVNNYDQPDHNLVAWWQERPYVHELAILLNTPLDKASDDQIVAIVDIWKGNGAELVGYNTTYRLEEVEEGVDTSKPKPRGKKKG